MSGAPPPVAGSLGRDYFDALYARNPNPWRLGASDYEHAKYADTLAALEGRRFVRAVEVGCAIGELTAVLAPACGEFLGVDVAEAALAQARRRNAGSPHVAFTHLPMPRERPPGRFDLIVLSEVLYYFSIEDLASVAAWVGEALAPDGAVLLVHWLGETPDYPQTGDEACETFLAATAQVLTIDLRRRRELYRIDRLARIRPAAGG